MRGKCFENADERREISERVFMSLSGEVSALVDAHRRFHGFLPAVLMLSASTSFAAVTAKEAWVRGTVPAQQTTGAFATLLSSDDAQVVEVRSPVAKTVEIHSSDMQDGVMRMRAVDRIALPAGKRVELKPGGFHVMLMGLAKPLAAGDKVPLVFVVEDRKGTRTTLEVLADVRPLGK
jgi:copper(I)-binding protein